MASKQRASAWAPSTPFECVEIYIPKKIETLAKLYTFLQSKLIERSAKAPADAIDGFSLYEVDGAFAGREIYQERTIVLRILFKRDQSQTEKSISKKIQLLGREVAASVAMKEEELWICHFPQGVIIFRPLDETGASNKE
ncbi:MULTISPECIES: hypothetical protein [unclassified Schlesneria]|uniref:hypothetical protein n=1 Tax=Schlesneria TaxID=656899 RepID=UPI002F06CFA9